MTIPNSPQEGKFRILLIEDDPAIARLVINFLTTAGFACLHAPDGIKGMQSFSDFDPHLVLLDLMMPVVDGEQVCLKIRRASAVPIIILTAKAVEEAELGAFKMGADDYITKPFSLRLLLERIETHLRRTYHSGIVEKPRDSDPDQT